VAERQCPVQSASRQLAQDEELPGERDVLARSQAVP
jgi:hypothetical protein